MRTIVRGRFLRRWAGALLVVGTVASAGAGIGARPARQASAAARPVSSALVSAPRPRIPSGFPQLWLVPDQPIAPSLAKPEADFAAGLRYFAREEHAQALPLLDAAARASTPLSAYAAFYGGLCRLNLSRQAEARAVFARLHASPQVVGFVAEAAIVREAEAAAAMGDHAAAARLYEELSSRKTASPEAVLLALGRESLAVEDRAHAAESFARVYYEFPLSDLTAAAATELEPLADLQPAKGSDARMRLDLVRAERLFVARRYAAARQAFESIEPDAKGDAAEIVELRLAECDHFLRRYQEARDRLLPLFDSASRKAEAQFFWLSATRELGESDEYVGLARQLVTAFPGTSWAEETLNNLATHYVLTDDDAQAEAVFQELYAKYPTGPHAERAAWRLGWWAHAHGRPRDTIAFYEGAAGAFPRSDYRPAYLYWSARSREQLGDAQGAAAVYRIVTRDYLNSYYGRLASKRSQGIAASAPQPASAASAPQPNTSAPAPPAPDAAPPPTADLIRLLLSLGLYDQARDELLYAQRTWGDTPMVGATLGWVYSKQGDFRRGIVAMKRAYPQYLAEEGAQMPPEALKVVFPLDFWPLIRKYAPKRDLDPYLVAALINQESAFDPRARSSAGAIGLMQVLPATGRQYARKLHIRRFSASSLTRPDINLQIGLAYFADIIQRAGGVHLALAGYNAGESHVRRWKSDRPGLDPDEYIDGIPFPETQTYVKRILGTSEDYRRLYADDTGTGGAAAAAAGSAPAAKTPKLAGKQAAPKKIKK